MKNPKVNIKSVYPPAALQSSFSNVLVWRAPCSRKTVFTKPCSTFLDRHNTTKSVHLMLALAFLESLISSTVLLFSLII